MAAIGMMIGGAVVNALAFTGGNYLFSMIGKSGEAEKERKLSSSSSGLNLNTSTSASYVLTT